MPVLPPPGVVLAGTFPAYSSRAADPQVQDHSTSLSLSGPERQGQHQARHVRS